MAVGGIALMRKHTGSTNSLASFGVSKSTNFFELHAAAIKFTVLNLVDTHELRCFAVKSRGRVLGVFTALKHLKITG